MKIVETITPVNADKTFIGSKEIKLTLDTDNGRVTIDAPAMFTDPIVQMDQLKDAVEKLEEYQKLADDRR
jgi:hypothetical protein